MHFAIGPAARYTHTRWPDAGTANFTYQPGPMRKRAPGPANQLQGLTFMGANRAGENLRRKRKRQLKNLKTKWAAEDAAAAGKPVKKAAPKKAAPKKAAAKKAE
jgi:hypothetical protein